MSLTQHTLNCKSCDSSSNNSEVYRDISLTLPAVEGDSDSSIPLESLIIDYLQQEEVDYTCPKCPSNSATISHMISKLPNMLIFHLKRFLVVGSSYIKRSDAIEIPNDLVLGGERFQLSGIVSHLGSTQKSGHYIFDKREDNQWTCYNDSQVNSVSDRTVARQKTAYIMTYVKVSQ